MSKRRFKVVSQDQTETKEHTAIGIHGLNQFFADPKQLSIFSSEKVAEFTQSTGLKLKGNPEDFGVVLNVSQKKVLEGILGAFSKNNYKGDTVVNKHDSLKEVYNMGSGEALKAINQPYKNINKVPVIKLTQSDLLTLSGYGRTQSDKAVVIDAISFLGTKQFCFYWTRLVKDNKGRPVVDTNGQYVKEQVMEVGTLFRVQYVKDDKGALNHYEIHPSAVLIDQVHAGYGGEYFLLVPTDWRDEVKELTGKRANNYTYEFLLWLRLQFEQIRRYNSNKKAKRPKRNFILNKTWEEVAIALKMPSSLYKANRKRASNMIRSVYDTAIKLGYLVKVEPNGHTDSLYLNENYYPQPGQLV